MKKFRSSFPPLPDSFVLIFRLFDILMSILLLIPMVLCILAAFLGISPPGIPAPFFSIGYLAVACYFALMIYGFSLDFRSGGFDALSIDKDKASFLLRNKVKKSMEMGSISSVKLVKIRLFLSFAYYTVFVSPVSKAVAEISDKDFAALGEILNQSGLQAGRPSEIPLFITSVTFRR